MTFDFTYRSYEALLRFIRDDLGRPIVPFREVPTDGPYVILRHDIDCSLRRALELAKLEYRLGVRSTVFVLLSSEYYNLLWADHLGLVREIAAMGHEIGLHYDAAILPGDAPSAQADALLRQARFVEEYIGSAITTVAQHNPSLTSARVPIHGLRDAYAPEYFKNIGYVSDSRRRFAVPDVYQFFRDHTRSQFLVHPLWYHEQSLTRSQSFDAIRADGDRDICRYLEEMTAEAEDYERRLHARDDSARR